MPLIKCPECGQMISEYADRCISCGCPMDKIKEIYERKSKQEATKQETQQVAETPKEKNTLLEDKLTEEEKQFISKFEVFLDRQIPNTFKFSNTDYYKGIQIKGTGKYPFTFKKPSSILLFRYPSSKNPEVFLTREIKTFDGQTASDLMSVIKAYVNAISKPKETLETIAEQQKRYRELIQTATSKDDNKKLKFLERISEEERRFVEKFNESVGRIVPNSFTYRNLRTRFALKHKLTKIYMFTFSIGGSSLVFSYTNDSYQFIDVPLKDLSNDTLSSLLNIVKEKLHISDIPKNKEQPIQKANVDEPAKDKANREPYYENLNEGQRLLAVSLENLVKGRFGDRVSISNNSMFLFFKKSGTDRNLFWFKKSANTFDFCYRLYDSDDIYKIRIKRYEDNLLKEVYTKAKTVLNSYNVAPIDIVEPEESALVNNNGNHSFSGSFYNSLFPEQRAFILSYINKINKKHGNIFSFSSDKKSISLKCQNAPGYRCYFIQIGDKLMFFYKIGIKDEIKDLEINKLDDEMMSVLLQKTNYVVASYNAQLMSGNVSTAEKKEEHQQVKPVEQPKNTKPSISIFEKIRLEMLGSKYDASPSEKALCKNLKKYLKNKLKIQPSDNLEGPVFNSATALFNSKMIAWNRNDGARCAKIVYDFFKADTIIEKIKNYEDIYKKEIITDYSSLVYYLYNEIATKNAIDFEHAPGLSSDFSLVPNNVIFNILENFAAYETE